MYVLHSFCRVNARPRPLPTPDVEQQNDSGREHRHLEKSYLIQKLRADHDLGGEGTVK